MAKITFFVNHIKSLLTIFGGAFMHRDYSLDDGLSRREKREQKFLRRAKSGYFGADTVLFLSEEKSLRKKGFLPVRASSKKEGSSPAYVSWEGAFKNGIPLIVFNYCIGVIEGFPKSAVENWAQELYVIAVRANFEKGLDVSKILSGRAQTTHNE